MSELRIGKRHRKRGALHRALTFARARAARLAASPPVMPRRAPAVDAAARIAACDDGSVIELARGSEPRADAVTTARLALVHVEGSFALGDYAFLEETRRALGGATSPILCAVDVFVDPRSMARARDAGADAVALVVRALEDAELGPLVSAARAQGLAVLLECRSAAEVDLAHACRADGVLAALLDRDRLRPDPEGAAAVQAHAVELGLPCFADLAPFRDLALTAAPSADPELAADPG